MPSVRRYLLNWSAPSYSPAEESDRDCGEFRTGYRRCRVKDVARSAVDHAGVRESRDGVVEPVGLRDVAIRVGLSPEVVARVLGQQTEEYRRDLRAGYLILGVDETVVAANYVGVVFTLFELGNRGILGRDDYDRRGDVLGGEDPVDRADFVLEIVPCLEREVECDVEVERVFALEFAEEDAVFEVARRLSLCRPC